MILYHQEIWSPSTDKPDAYYFAYPLVEFDFKPLDSLNSVDATLVSTVNINDGLGNQLNLSLNFAVESLGYDSYSLILKNASYNTTGNLISDKNIYSIKFDIYDFEYGEEYTEYEEGKFIGGEVASYDYFALDYKLSIEGVSAILTTTPDPAPTPEPTTLLLTSLGLAGIGFAKKRKKVV